MRRALERQVGEVVTLGPARAPVVEIPGKIRSRLGSFIGQQYDWRHSRALAEAYRRHFSKAVEGAFDLLVAPAAATEIALLPPTRAPVVYASDTTFTLLHNYYPAYKHLGAQNVREANDIERGALHRATSVALPSRWAAESAVRDYGVPTERVHLVPFGANLEDVPAKDRVLTRTRTDELSLVLVGVDWWRKGCDIAVATLAYLREHGHNARLTIIGCRPPRRITPDVEIIEHLDMSASADRRRYTDILFRSHLLLLPTRAECCGVVIAEASAHGVPSIVANTGGVGGMLIEGQNGVLVPRDSDGEAWGNAILAMVADRDRYSRLCLSARAIYDERLNWDAWARDVARIAGESSAQ